MVQDTIPPDVLADYQAAVQAHYKAGAFNTPCAARLAMLRRLKESLGEGWCRLNARDLQELWAREERLAQWGTA